MAAVLWWLMVLIGLLLIGFFAAVRVKKWLKEPDDPLTPAGFTLSDLRAMHRNGQISDDEFARAKEVIVSVSRRPEPRPGGDAAPPFDAGRSA